MIKMLSISSENKEPSIADLKKFAESITSELKLLHCKPMLSPSSNHLELLLQDLANGRFDEDKYKLCKRVQSHMQNSSNWKRSHGLTNVNTSENVKGKFIVNKPKNIRVNTLHTPLARKPFVPSNSMPRQKTSFGISNSLFDNRNKNLKSGYDRISNLNYNSYQSHGTKFSQQSSKKERIKRPCKQIDRNSFKTSSNSLIKIVNPLLNKSTLRISKHPPINIVPEMIPRSREKMHICNKYSQSEIPLKGSHHVKLKKTNHPNIQIPPLRKQLLYNINLPPCEKITVTPPNQNLFEVAHSNSVSSNDDFYIRFPFHTCKNDKIKSDFHIRSKPEPDILRKKSNPKVIRNHQVISKNSEDETHGFHHHEQVPKLISDPEFSTKRFIDRLEKQLGKMLISLPNERFLDLGTFKFNNGEFPSNEEQLTTHQGSKHDNVNIGENKLVNDNDDNNGSIDNDFGKYQCLEVRGVDNVSNDSKCENYLYSNTDDCPKTSVDSVSPDSVNVNTSISFHSEKITDDTSNISLKVDEDPSIHSDVDAVHALIGKEIIDESTSSLVSLEKEQVLQPEKYVKFADKENPRTKELAGDSGSDQNKDILFASSLDQENNGREFINQDSKDAETKGNCEIKELEKVPDSSLMGIRNDNLELLGSEGDFVVSDLSKIEDISMNREKISMDDEILDDERKHETNERVSSRVDSSQTSDVIDRSEEDFSTPCDNKKQQGIILHEELETRNPSNSSDITFVNGSGGSISTGEIIVPSIEIADVTISEGEIAFEASFCDILPGNHISIRFCTNEKFLQGLATDTISSESMDISSVQGTSLFINKETQTSDVENRGETLIESEEKTTLTYSTVSDGEIPDDDSSRPMEEEVTELKRENEILRKRLSGYAGRLISRSKDSKD